MLIWLDGKLVDQSEAKVSVFDHGLLYGDGVFEGIRFYDNRIFRLEEHIQRLYDSARAILLDCGMTQEEMCAACAETVKANGLKDGYIRLLVTRGVGSLGLNPFQCPKSSVIIIAASISLYPEENYVNGLEMVTCSTRRLAPGAFTPQIKSLNYLNNIMAKIEALKAGVQEGIMLNEAGNVAECTGDNIFIIKKGIVYTPPVNDGALDGITRRVAMEVCEALGIECHEKTLNRYDIYTADECFLTGTAAEVIPVTVLDCRKIGEGKPGPVTAKITTKFKELTRSSGYPIG